MLYQLHLVTSRFWWNILVAYKKIIYKVAQINSVEGDNQFWFKAFQEYNKENYIKIDTLIAKDEHISQGNKLGIIDRLVRTLKEMIDRYRIAVSKQTSFPTILDKVIRTYNSQLHTTIKQHLMKCIMI
jgi:hypothetical protein